jgi:hypothetical protein
LEVIVLFLLSLASFYVFVSIFSDGAESEARWKIFAVSLVATMLLYSPVGKSPLLSFAIACIAAAVVSLVGLIFWLKVTKLQALKITGSYIGFVFASSLVIGLIFRAFGVRSA